MTSHIGKVKRTVSDFGFILDCKDLPSIPNAETKERFGLQRQFNIGNKYACHDNFKMQGRPFAVCQNTGDWKILFSCIYDCGTHGFQFDGETTTCIKLISTSGSTWKEARTFCQQQQGGDLVSIVSKEKWDSVFGYFSGFGRVWIGLKDKRWMTGESFNNIFGITVQLNDYDADYPTEVENTCGILAPLSSSQLQDENCNVRKRKNFLCEIRISQN
ncbi:MRC [Mytilus coruscus]|uniref:MRC n=1 Tax=Mytilus coruscus TaxID=42192 RepID=A0A6J8E849_MYTCO|nr:MRC [Mytilus coruscus]